MVKLSKAFPFVYSRFLSANLLVNIINGTFVDSKPGSIHYPGWSEIM